MVLRLILIFQKCKCHQKIEKKSAYIMYSQPLVLGLQSTGQIPLLITRSPCPQLPRWCFGSSRGTRRLNWVCPTGGADTRPPHTADCPAKHCQLPTRLNMFITIANCDYQYTYIPCTNDTVKICELLFFYVSSDVICKDKICRIKYLRIHDWQIQGWQQISEIYHGPSRCITVSSTRLILRSKSS